MELLLIFLSHALASLVGLPSKRRGVIEWSAVMAAGLACIGAVLTARQVVQTGAYSPLPFFWVDPLGALLLLLIGVVGVICAAYAVVYLRRETDKGVIGLTRVRQFFVLLNLFLLVMALAVTSASPVFTWISIEATTLSTAFLISFYNKPSSMEAAWKYLIINSVGLLIAFLGTLLYFTAVGESTLHAFVSWQALATAAANLDPAIAKIAFVFILIGYGTKVGLAPMHTWLPDAHSKAPAPVSALLSGVLLNVAFLAVLRFKLVTDVAVGSAFSGGLLITLGILSIAVASFLMMAQNNYKRLLAYSSIENMGVVALGFGFGGLGAIAALWHLISHALLKSSLFLCAGTIFLRFSSTKIAKVCGVLTALPFTGVLFFLGFLALTGAPPFGIFYTKLLILSAGVEAHAAVTAAALLLMAMVFVGFFKQVAAMSFGDVPEGVKRGTASVWLIFPPLTLMALALWLGVHAPAPLLALVQQAVSPF